MTRDSREARQRGGKAPPRFHLGKAIANSKQRGWPLVMAIINVTPDSFSDGGRYAGASSAVEQALSFVAQGADIIDVGGESTRPGARAADIDEELARVIPVIEGIRKAGNTPISIDTSKTEVMRAAAAAGADVINDVRALSARGAMQLAAQLQLPVILMHMLGEPATMQQKPHYHDVVAQVRTYLVDRAAQCEHAGISKLQIVLDPGFGFGKNVQHNLSLLKHLDMLCEAGYPVLAGLSRKSMIGKLLDRDVAQRMPASIALALEAASRGASIIRVHDVAATIDALKMRAAVASAS